MEITVKLLFSEDWDIYADMDEKLIVKNAIRELAEGVTIDYKMDFPVMSVPVCERCCKETTLLENGICYECIFDEENKKRSVKK